MYFSGHMFATVRCLEPLGEISYFFRGRLDRHSDIAF
jgi:hypothetical protein